MVDLAFLHNFFASLHLERYFLNVQGLYTLLAVLPLIIFYLIRPKPKDKIIPSLMFILAQSQKWMENSFFRRLMNNLLFFIQLLILLLLGAAAGMPFLSLEHSVSADDTVLVFDTSASMNALSGTATRWEIAKERASEFITEKNTIVLAADIPELVLKDGSRGDSYNALGKASPKDTSTNLGDAIQFAADQFANKKGRIVVFSDFINSETDPVAMKKVLESKDIRVDFVDVSGKAENVGIIDLSLGEESSSVFIKNYNQETASARVAIAGQEQEVEIPAGSVESIIFSTPRGQNKVEILAKDDFSPDNVAYFSTPKEEKTNILFITNSNSRSNLYYALAANPSFVVERVVPPIVPNVNHDVYVLQDVNGDLLLPEITRKIKEGLEKGDILIIAAGEDTPKLDLGGLLPVDYSSQNPAKDSSYVQVVQVTKFTKDVEFGDASYYLGVYPKEGSTVIAVAQENNATMLSFLPVGGGKAIFYNLDDSASGFKSSLTYPLFWTNLVEGLLDRDSIKSLNYQTGQTVNGQLLQKAGFIDLESKTIAVNMLNDKESDVGKQGDLSEISGALEGEQFSVRSDTPIDGYIVVLAIIFLFLEFLYIKIRGDL